jgi:uncharacterized protein YuzE
MDKDKVKLWFDDEVDILYISLKKGPSVHSEEKEEGVRLEYDASGQLVGLEVTNVTRKLVQPLARRLATAWPHTTQESGSHPQPHL